MVVGFFYAENTKAHPHSWISVDIELHWNEQGEVTGFSESWVFDQAVSAYFLVEVSTKANRNNQSNNNQLNNDQAYNNLADSDPENPETAPTYDRELILSAITPIVERLAAFNYFTGIRLNGSKYDIPNIKNIQGFIHPSNARLGMRFVVPFAEPIRPDKDALKFAVYDPTYYSAVLYGEKNISHIRPADMATNSECATKLVIPEPDLEFVSYVASLPPSVENDEAIGDAFAVWVEVHCASERT